MKSMTGFGRGSSTCGDLTITLEINSVNRRGFETSYSLPREWQVFERELTDLLRTQVQRGKIHTQMQIDQASAKGALSWDQAAVDVSLARIGELAARLGTPWPPDPLTLVKVLALHKTDGTLPSPDDARAAVFAAHGEAFAAFEAMREREGAHLLADLAARLDLLIRLTDEIREIAPGTVDRYRELLFSRLRQAGLELELSDERVLKEVAIFADRCDVAEEITRLASHFAQIRETLDQSGTEPIGRKLEFLIQEVHREVNTIGSKANNIEVARRIIEMKNEIERIREQIQNVE